MPAGANTGSGEVEPEALASVPLLRDSFNLLQHLPQKG